MRGWTGQIWFVLALFIGVEAMEVATQVALKNEDFWLMFRVSATHGFYFVGLGAALMGILSRFVARRIAKRKARWDTILIFMTKNPGSYGGLELCKRIGVISRSSIYVDMDRMNSMGFVAYERRDSSGRRWFYATEKGKKRAKLAMKIVKNMTKNEEYAKSISQMETK